MYPVHQSTVSHLYVPSSTIQSAVCINPVQQSTVSRLYIPSLSIHSQPSICTQFINPQSAICTYPVHPSTLSQLSVCTKFINPVSCLYVPSSSNPQSGVCMYPIHQSTVSQPLSVPSSSIHSQPSVCTQFIQYTVSHLYIPSSSNPWPAIGIYPVHPCLGLHICRFNHDVVAPWYSLPKKLQV